MYFKRMLNSALEPSRAHEKDAGLDIFASDGVRLRPGEVLTVETGVHIALPEGSQGFFWDRSGLGSRGLTILGGCIDGPYRGELKVVVANVNLWDFLQDMSNPEKYTIVVPYGKAITQLVVFSGVELVTPIELDPQTWDDLCLESERGEKGFGSSDI